MRSQLILKMQELGTTSTSLNQINVTQRFRTPKFFGDFHSAQDHLSAARTKLADIVLNIDNLITRVEKEKARGPTITQRVGRTVGKVLTGAGQRLSALETEGRHYFEPDVGGPRCRICGQLRDSPIHLHHGLGDQTVHMRRTSREGRFTS